MAWLRPERSLRSSGRPRTLRSRLATPRRTGCAPSVCWDLAATGIRVGEPQASSLASSGPAYHSLVTLQNDSIPAGVITPIQVLPPPDRQNLGMTTHHVPAVYAAASPASALLSVLPRAETSTPAGQATINAVRAAAPGGGIGGDGAQEADFVHAVYGSFPSWSA